MNPGYLLSDQTAARVRDWLAESLTTSAAPPADPLPRPQAWCRRFDATPADSEGWFKGQVLRVAGDVLEPTTPDVSNCLVRPGYGPAFLVGTNYPAVRVANKSDGTARFVLWNGGPSPELALGVAVTSVQCDAVGQLLVTTAPVYRPVTASPPPYSGLYAQVDGTVRVAGQIAANRLLTLSGASLDYQVRTNANGYYQFGGMLINQTYAVSLAPRPGEPVLDPVSITITNTTTTQTVDFHVSPPP